MPSEELNQSIAGASNVSFNQDLGHDHSSDEEQGPTKIEAAV